MNEGGLTGRPKENRYGNTTFTYSISINNPVWTVKYRSCSPERIQDHDPEPKDVLCPNLKTSLSSRGSKGTRHECISTRKETSAVEDNTSLVQGKRDTLQSIDPETIVYTPSHQYRSTVRKGRWMVLRKGTLVPPFWLYRWSFSVRYIHDCCLETSTIEINTNNKTTVPTSRRKVCVLDPGLLGWGRRRKSFFGTEGNKKI